MDFDGVGTPVIKIDEWNPQCGTDDARATVSSGSPTNRTSTAEVHEEARARRAATDCSGVRLLASHIELGRLGVGVRLYFTCLMHMGVLFTIATLFVAASIYFNSMGSICVGVCVCVCLAPQQAPGGLGDPEIRIPQRHSMRKALTCAQLGARSGIFVAAHHDDAMLGSELDDMVCVPGRPRSPGGCSRARPGAGDRSADGMGRQEHRQKRWLFA